MGSYAPDHIQAEVRALAIQGYRAPTIAIKTGVPQSTVYNWLERWEELGTEEDREILNQEKRISLLAGTVLQQEMESVLQGKKDISPRDAAVVYGISRSKEHERSQRAQNIQNNAITFVILNNNPESNDIETNARVVTDGAERTNERGIELANAQQERTPEP